MLTATQLRERLHYDPDTGIFTWLVTVNARCKAGSRTSHALSGTGYRRVCINYRRHPVHRLAWLYVYGQFPKGDIDHINGDKTDNRIVNLREATRAQNLRNRGKNNNNTSGFKGVHWDCRRRAWLANIGINGCNLYLGRFSTAQEAHAAYCRAAKQYHGEFARVD